MTPKRRRQAAEQRRRDSAFSASPVRARSVRGLRLAQQLQQRDADVLLHRRDGALVARQVPEQALLEQAVKKFDAVHMAFYAAVVRRRHGELLGGEQGQALVEQADTWMSRQGVRNPARMTDLMAPGFPPSNARR